MKKIIKVIKNNIIAFALGIIVASTIGVYAATTLASNTVYYDNSKSGGSSNTVSGALDELYEKLESTKFEVGDYVTMTPTKTSATIPLALTGYDSNQTIAPCWLKNWVVIRINDNGTIDMVSEKVSTESVYFKGQTGYQSFVGTLNYIAKQYENPKYTVGSRHIGYNGQPEYKYLNDMDNSEKSDELYQTDIDLIEQAMGTLKSKQDYGYTWPYWIASRYNTSVTTNRVTYKYSGRYISNEGTVIDYESNLLYTNTVGYGSHYSAGFRVRPIVTLKSGIKASSGNGTSSNPYILN